MGRPLFTETRGTEKRVDNFFKWLAAMAGDLIRSRRQADQVEIDTAKEDGGRRFGLCRCESDRRRRFDQRPEGPGKRMSRTGRGGLRPIRALVDPLTNRRDIGRRQFPAWWHCAGRNLCKQATAATMAGREKGAGCVGLIQAEAGHLHCGAVTGVTIGR